MTKPQEEEKKPETEQEKVPEKEENNYVGEEEKESNNEKDTSKSNEEKAIELAKKEWGEKDNSVTYSIERKEENKYYIAVKKNATVQLWYEVDTQNWTIKEY